MTPFLTDAVVDDALDTADLERALQAGVRLVYVRDRVGAAALRSSPRHCTAAATAQWPSTCPDRSSPSPSPRSGRQHAAKPVCTSRTLVAGPVEAMADDGGGCGAWSRER